MVIAPLAHWHVWERKFIEEFRIPDAPVAQWAMASRERVRSRPPQERCPWTDARRRIIIATGGRGHLAPPHIAESGNKWRNRERERPMAWRSEPTAGASLRVVAQTIAALPPARAVHAHAVSARTTPRWRGAARAPPRLRRSARSQYSRRPHRARLARDSAGDRSSDSQRGPAVRPAAPPRTLHKRSPGSRGWRAERGRCPRASALRSCRAGRRGHPKFPFRTPSVS